MSNSFGISFRLLILFLFFSFCCLFAQPAEVKLTASDGQASDGFGIEVAVDGGWAAITSTSRNVGAGAVYVFQYDNGNWVERDILVGSDTKQMELFGTSVDIWGNYLVSGAIRHPEVGFGPGEEGAVYIFKLDNGTWMEQAKIQSSDKIKGDEFGHDVAIYQDYILVGAPFDSAGGKVSAGKAFVFKGSSGNWVQEDSLVASDGDAGENFGRAVDIYGDYAMVGSQNPIHDFRGAVYVFQRNGTDWTQIDKLVPNDLQPQDDFGISISMDGDLAIIGAMNGEGNEVGSGVAYVFKRDGSTWQQEAKLIGSNAIAAPLFGFRVGISGDYAIVGARNQAVGTSVFQGAAYLFKRTGTTWTEVMEIVSSDGDESDSFGNAVAIDGDTVVVGAESDELGVGSAYIFTGFMTTSVGDLEGFNHPTDFKLEQTYPNPFNPSTKISFSISSLMNNSDISIAIFDAKGLHVRSLFQGRLPSGSHELEWNGQNDQGMSLASGIYVLQLRSGNSIHTQKMTLLK